MKKLCVLGLLLCSVLTMNAQSYIGFHSDNYNGVHGVLFNPANIVDSRFKTDINLASGSALIGSDYFAIDFAAFGDSFDIDTDSKKSPSNNNNFFTNVDILGPSFMFNIKPKHSVAFYSRFRVFGNISEINGTLYENLDNDFQTNDDFFANEGNMFSTTQGWLEAGVSYATVLLDKQEHFLKGGLTLKYLQGLGSASVESNNLTANYNSTLDELSTNGVVTFNSSSNLQNDSADFKFVDGATGFGVDLGFVYEWRPDFKDYQQKNKAGKSIWLKDKNKYKLKTSLSLTDIGSVSYQSTKSVYNLNGITFDRTDFALSSDIQELIERRVTPTETVENIKTSLPMALHAMVDYNINNWFYVNLNYDTNARGAAGNSSRIVNNLTLTPRFESKWFSFYSPIGINEFSDFSWGAGLRAGPVFVGSGSILSNVISSESKSTDVYVGLKIPIYQGRAKDRDKDGVLDKLDACPKVAGPVENNGCPWGDRDGDTVLDNEDTCPEVAGPVENKGCPWPDTDGDTVLDKDDACPEIAGAVELNGCPDTDGDGVSDNKDKCVDVAGPVENNGCPWPDTDKDGVTDNIDKCPNEPGVAANNGCPEIVIKEAAVKKLNDFARAIYFNSGRTSFRPGVKGKLDLIAGIMKEYPKANFKVEGHTDSAGSAKTNQNLSNRRAKAVLDYLVHRAGIAPNRLSSVGYGESNPIATNKTRAGRAENRRVELKLVK